MCELYCAIFKGVVVEMQYCSESVKGYKCQEKYTSWKGNNGCIIQMVFDCTLNYSFYIILKR